MSIGERVGEAPVSLTFFDGASRVHGMARAGLTLIFEGATPSMARRAGGGAHGRRLSRLRRRHPRARVHAGERGGSARRLADTRLPRERTREGQADRLHGDRGRDPLTPEWEELDALRAVSALFDSDHAVLAVARRPRGAPGHGRELITAALLTGGELRAVEDARLSTVYDGDGRQRSAGMELWMPGEDFPRRLAGEAAGGTTLELPGLQVNASVFDWRMEGREGTGSYEVTVRAEPQAAA